MRRQALGHTVGCWVLLLAVIGCVIATDDTNSDGSGVNTNVNTNVTTDNDGVGLALAVFDFAGPQALWLWELFWSIATPILSPIAAHVLKLLSHHVVGMFVVAVLASWSTLIVKRLSKRRRTGNTESCDWLVSWWTQHPPPSLDALGRAFAAAIELELNEQHGSLHGAKATPISFGSRPQMPRITDIRCTRKQQPNNNTFATVLECHVDYHAASGVDATFELSSKHRQLRVQLQRIQGQVMLTLGHGMCSATFVEKPTIRLSVENLLPNTKFDMTRMSRLVTSSVASVITAPSSIDWYLDQVSPRGSKRLALAGNANVAGHQHTLGSRGHGSAVGNGTQGAAGPLSGTVPAAGNSFSGNANAASLFDDLDAGFGSAPVSQGMFEETVTWSAKLTINQISLQNLPITRATKVMCHVALDSPYQTRESEVLPAAATTLFRPEMELDVSFQSQSMTIEVIAVASDECIGSAQFDMSALPRANMASTIVCPFVALNPTSVDTQLTVMLTMDHLQVDDIPANMVRLRTSTNAHAVRSLHHSSAANVLSGHPNINVDGSVSSVDSSDTFQSSVWNSVSRPVEILETKHSYGRHLSIASNSDAPPELRGWNAKVTKLYAYNMHLFASISSTNNVTCDACKQSLKKRKGHGLRCRGCGLIVHQSCFSNAEVPCTSSPLPRLVGQPGSSASSVSSRNKTT